MRRPAALAALFLVVGACGDASEAPATTTPPATSSTTMATTTTTTVPPTTTVTTSAPTTTVAPRTGVLASPILEDGRPATFMAVTDDFRAVEVETLTGEVVAEYGQMSTPEELDAAGEDAAFEIVIDAIWRTTDGEWVVVSECCEPAGGTIHYLAEGQVLTPDTHDESITSDGWTAAPSPYSGDVAVLGYFLRVGPVDDLPATREADQESSFPTGVPAWDASGRRVHWLGERFGGANRTVLNTADLGVDDPRQWETVELDWLGDEEFLDGVATQASGNLVAFRNDVGEGGTDGVVFTPGGELVASFPVEDDSRFGGYDPSGRFLIYVDGDDTVRWQGLGQSGELGDGYIHASW